MNTADLKISFTIAIFTIIIFFIKNIVELTYVFGPSDMYEPFKHMVSESNYYYSILTTIIAIMISYNLANTQFVKKMIGE
jgi:hypothetical protein